MDNVTFYREIVDLGAYSVFNGIRGALFMALASDSHLPIAHNMLDSVFEECPRISDDQIVFVKDRIIDGDRFRFHQCTSDGLQLYYFVNVSRDVEMDHPIASHLQAVYPEPIQKVVATSAIVLYEKHGRIIPANYPKIIKHELSHAAIEFVIRDNKELQEFYFGDNKGEFKDFGEFVCDVLPYLANPSKKENGLNRFVEECPICFGYDAEEDVPEFIRDVNDAILAGPIIHEENEETEDETDSTTL